MTDMQPRAPWMTEALEAKLKELAIGRVLTCTQIQEFAKEHNIEITKMKPFVDLIGLEVTGCQKLCS